MATATVKIGLTMALTPASPMDRTIRTGMGMTITAEGITGIMMMTTMMIEEEDMIKIARGKAIRTAVTTEDNFIRQ
jgi:predicted ribosome-associated RNA-binding protein Tma20